MMSSAGFRCYSRVVLDFLPLNNAGLMPILDCTYFSRPFFHILRRRLAADSSLCNNELTPLPLLKKLM